MLQAGCRCRHGQAEGPRTVLLQDVLKGARGRACLGIDLKAWVWILGHSLGPGLLIACHSDLREKALGEQQQSSGALMQAWVQLSYRVENVVAMGKGF